MKWRWPWEPDDEDVTPGISTMDPIQEEKEALQRDTSQIKHVNRNTLIRALARGWLDEEQAEALRAIQMDKEPTEEERVDGVDTATD